jgi:hypothetical protein
MARTATAKPAFDSKSAFSRYVPNYVQDVCAGANPKLKKAGRPFTFDVRVFRVNTKDSGPILSTYLMFGGVPTPKLHELLETEGFKVRRRPRTWTGKDGKVVDIAERDNECYSVYYNTNQTITEGQMSLIAKIFGSLNKSLTTGKAPLLASWEAIEESWGDKDKWLSICAVDSSTKKATVAEPDEEDGLDTSSILDDVDDLL